MWFEGGAYSAYRAAFRLHHGREPEGTVTSACDELLCVSGTHVEDRPMREQRQAAERRKRQEERRLDRLYSGIFGVAA
jgi:hypothetical protein